MGFGIKYGKYYNNMIIIEKVFPKFPKKTRYTIYKKTKMNGFHFSDIYGVYAQKLGNMGNRQFWEIFFSI